MRRADLNALMDRLRSSYGEDSARRLQRAADEIPGLDTRYSPEALDEVFLRDRDSAITNMHPGDFEKYAARLPEKGHDNSGYTYFDWDTGREMGYDDYMDYLNTIDTRGGFTDTPFLNVAHDDSDPSVADLPRIGAHEGRHRNRAMNKFGHTTGLVRVRASGALQKKLENGPTYETAWRTPEEKRQAFIEHMAAHDNMVYPQKERANPWRDSLRMPDLYAEGGRVGFADGGGVGPGRELDELGFYSKALEEAKAIKQPKGKLSDYLRYLKGKGVKDSEIKALKLHQDKDEVLTKEQLADRIRQRRVKLKAEVRSKKAVDEWVKKRDGLWGDAFKDAMGAGDRSKADDVYLAKQAWEKDNPPPKGPSDQYEGYTRKGGDNYTEQLLSLARKSEMRTGLFRKGQYNGLPSTIYDSPEDAQKAREALSGPGMPQEFRDQYEIRDFEHHEDPLYTASHFNSYPNLLAHIRSKDRTTPEGHKVLYGEEFQSDWAQQGRDQGFKPENYDQIQEAAKLAHTNAWNAKMAYQNHGQNLRGEYMKANPYPDGPWSQDKQGRINDWETRYQDHLANHPEHQRLFEEYSRTDKESRALQDQLFKMRKAANGLNPGPYVTDTNDWVDLALKKHLMDADRGGYDAVGWAPGEENADHYSQRLRGIKSLHWVDPELDDDGEPIDHDGFLEAYDGDGTVMYEGYHRPEDLHQVIGRERAAELLAAPHTPRRRGSTQYVRKLDFPEGMEFGGEGMSKFYNEIVRNRMRKLVRGLDPAADVEWAPVSEEASSKYDWSTGRDVTDTAYRPAHLVRLTPAMREKLKGGLEQFKRGGEVERGGFARGGLVDYQHELSSANRGMNPDEDGILAYPRDRYIDPHYGATVAKGWTLNPNLREDEFLRYPGVEHDIGEPYFNAPTGRFRTYAEGGTVKPKKAILRPAVRWGDDVYVADPGESHFGAIRKAPEHLRSRITLDGDSRGYLTSTGRFVDRREGARIATKHDLWGGLAPTTQLPSEDIDREKNGYAEGGVAREGFDAGGYATGSYGNSFADNSRPGSGGGVWGSGLTQSQLNAATQDMSNFYGIGRDVGFGTVGGISYGVGPSYNASGQAIGGGGRTPTPYAQTIPGARPAGNPADAAGAGGGAQPGSVREALGFSPVAAKSQEAPQETFANQQKQAAAAADPTGTGFGGLSGGAAALAGFALAGMKPGEDRTAPADSGFMSPREQQSYTRFQDTARNTMMEAGNQSDEGMLGVAFSGANRAGINYGGIGPGGIDTTGYNDPEASFDQNVTRQIYAPVQYSWTNPAYSKATGVNVDKARGIADREMQADPDTAQRAYAAAYAQQFGGATDPTYGALSYHADYVSPAWKRDALALGPTTTIGDHTFYGGSPPSLSPTQVAGPGIAQAMQTMASPWGFSSRTPVNDMADQSAAWNTPVSQVGLPSISRPISYTPASAYTGMASQAYDGERNAAPGVPFGAPQEGAVRTWMNPMSEPDYLPGFTPRPQYSVQQGVPLADITPRAPSMSPLARAYTAPSERDNAYGVADTVQSYDPLSSIRGPATVDPLGFRQVPTTRVAGVTDDPGYTRAAYHDTTYDAPEAAYTRMGYHDTAYDAPTDKFQTRLPGTGYDSPPSQLAGDPEAQRALEGALQQRAAAMREGPITVANVPMPPERPADLAAASFTGRPAYGTPGNPVSRADMAALGLGDATAQQLRSYRSTLGRGETVGYEPGTPGYKVPGVVHGTRADPLSDAEMAAEGLGDPKSWVQRHFGFRNNDEVDAATAPYRDPQTGQWVDPAFSSTWQGKAAAWGLGLGLTALSPAAGLVYGITALAGKNPMINGMDRLANRFGYEAHTPTDDPASRGSWFGSSGNGGGTSSTPANAPGFEGYGQGRSLSTFNGNSGGNGYEAARYYPYAASAVANPVKTASKDKPAEPEHPAYWDDMDPWQQALWSGTYG